MLRSYVYNALIAVFNIMRSRQNCRHFADDMFKCIFLYENVWISLTRSLQLVPKVRFNNIPADNGSDNGLAPTRRQAITFRHCTVIVSGQSDINSTSIFLFTCKVRYHMISDRLIPISDCTMRVNTMEVIRYDDKCFWFFYPENFGYIGLTGDRWIPHRKGHS